MVSQLLKISPIKPSFDYIKDIYESCLERYLQNPKNMGYALDSINNGRKILESDDEVDTYIAFYGAHHYYKLVEAFHALDMSRFCDRQLEIFSYGCGAATDTCSLISYCRAKAIKLPFKKLTLIEPSKIGLQRGIKYIQEALSDEELNKINIKQIHKTLQELEEYDLNSESEIQKLHVFSNILDLQEINLDNLALMLKKTQKEYNYFICVNPKDQEGQSKRRIDDFYNKLSNLFKMLDISINDKNITSKKIWIMRNNHFSDQYPIYRYHRIFQANSI